jgi:hypothetical protein
VVEASKPARVRCTAFQGERRIASGELSRVARSAKAAADRNGSSAILIFDDETSELIEVDFRGTAADVVRRLSNGEPHSPAREVERRRGPGRPKLGVVAREVTLLPRHWDWLNSQRGGASVALRRLVDEARRANVGADRKRRSQEAAYRFLYAMAGDRAGFEEATRALFASDRERFESHTREWPADIRNHARMLAAGAFEGIEK